jgi:hypothetical protein
VSLEVGESMVGRWPDVAEMAADADAVVMDGVEIADCRAAWCVRNVTFGGGGSSLGRLVGKAKG